MTSTNKHVHKSAFAMDAEIHCSGEDGLTAASQHHNDCQPVQWQTLHTCHPQPCKN